ncbi:MAG: type II toxin-antitoxin system RelE/ParE family toxin [Rhodospirillales bacterium]|nr:type II toxin-antitoxin system RelE/ParE family toxin [Rhodospirillales bacterium]
MCLYMFAKNQGGNITEKEQLALSERGDAYMRLSAAKLDALVADGILVEVACDGDEQERRNSR